MSSTKYIIVSDESKRSGKKYSYFYGGCIINESLYEILATNSLHIKNIWGYMR